MNIRKNLSDTKSDAEIILQVTRIKNKLMYKVLSGGSKLQTIRFANFCTKYQYIQYKLEQLKEF